MKPLPDDSVIDHSASRTRENQQAPNGETRRRMSPYQWCSIVLRALSLLSIGLAALSLVNLARQTELNTQQARSANMAAIDAIFVQNARFYPYFYEGRPIAPQDADYAQVLTIAMATTNYLESSLDQYDRIPAWRQYIDDQFALSPILCDYLDFRRTWFDSKLVAIMEKNRGRLTISAERARLLPESPR